MITSIPPFSTLVLKHHISSLCLKNKVFHQKLPHKCFYTLSIIGPLGRNHRIYFHFYVILSVSVCIFWGFFSEHMLLRNLRKNFPSVVKSKFYNLDSLHRQNHSFHVNFTWCFSFEIHVKVYMWDSCENNISCEIQKGFPQKFSCEIQFYYSIYVKMFTGFSHAMLLSV